jgi:hypothetical protein
LVQAETRPQLMHSKLWTWWETLSGFALWLRHLGALTFADASFDLVL